MGLAKVRARADTNTDMMTWEARIIDDWSLESDGGGILI